MQENDNGPAIHRFNVRVYGILRNMQDEILVSDEYIQGMEMTKFPGGGVEFGEGLHDCLRREWKEETGCDIEINDHFYTTHFFVPSFLKDGSQVMSVYYTVKLKEDSSLIASTEKKAFHGNSAGEEHQRWVRIEDLNPEDFFSVIDRHVVRMLK